MRQAIHTANNGTYVLELVHRNSSDAPPLGMHIYHESDVQHTPANMGCQLEEEERKEDGVGGDNPSIYLWKERHQPHHALGLALPQPLVVGAPEHGGKGRREEQTFSDEVCEIFLDADKSFFDHWGGSGTLAARLHRTTLKMIDIIYQVDGIYSKNGSFF
jgi:hypothetical protein